MRTRYLIIIVLVVLNSFVSGCASNKTTSKTDEAMELLQLAEKQYRRGMLTDAEASYRKITQELPEYKEAWLKLGNIYVRTGQLEAAIVAYESCTQQQADEVRCWNNLALARVKQAMAILEAGQKQLREGSPDQNRLIAFYGKLIRVISTK